MRVEDLSTYEIIEKRQIPDINSVTYLCRHKKTGARVALVSNDDENKVFSIGFRTTPKDSTGVAHILEHSVLCGSKEFPVKDPFVELVKGSLNTFLNAMTYPDKTIPGCKLQRQRFPEPDGCLYGCGFLPEYLQKRIYFPTGRLAL